MPTLNKKTWQYLTGSFQKGRFAQAYLFVGPEGTGKFELALDLARQVNNLSLSAESLANQGHPDVLVVQPLVEEKKGKRKEKDISIEQIKEILPKIGLYAYQGPYKFLIIDKADRLTGTAANSLLKLIEEPPTDTCIILTAYNEQAVLPTIRSRCQIVRLGLLKTELIVEHLREQYPLIDPIHLQAAAEFSRGRIQLARQLAQDESLLQQRQKMVQEFRQALRAGIGKAFELISQLSGDKKQLLQNMEEWIWYLNRFQLKLAQDNADIRMQKKTLQIIKQLISTKKVIEQSNANEKLQMENYFVQIT